MKKTLFLVLALVACSAVGFAQNGKAFYNSPYETRNSGSFNQNTALLSFGLGFPNVPVNGYGGYGTFYDNNHSASPVLYAKFEHGFLRDEVGLGGHIAFGGGSYKYNNGQDKIKIAAFSLAILGYYHFNKLIPVKNLDVYAGLGLGFRNVAYNYNFSNNNPGNNSDGNVFVTGKVGARYYFKPSFGVYGEVGFDQMSDVNLGVTFRLAQ